MSTHGPASKRVTVQSFAEKKQAGQKLTMLTAYDYSLARALDAAGLDALLVGDSAANVVHGYRSTLPITLDEMISHGRAVARAAKRALVVVDLPFGTYQTAPDDAVRAAVRVIKETGGAQAVKIEGGREQVDAIRRILAAGVPVMGHLGLMPQAINQYGSYALRAQDTAEAAKLLEDAQLLQEAGCFALVLEKIPAPLAKRVTEALRIPTIGIGAGPHCDGQVLVAHDMLGLNLAINPRFLRRYANLYDTIVQAAQAYKADVEAGTYPSEDESYFADDAG